MVFTAEGLFEVAIETLYSYFNFIVCSVFDFISAIAFVSRHVYFN